MDMRVRAFAWLARRPAPIAGRPPALIQVAEPGPLREGGLRYAFPLRALTPQVAPS
jgi:hypothetical protein